MKICALLCWFDEPCEWLAATVASLGKIADHIVALDGAYFHYPSALLYPTSPADQAATITETARQVGLASTVYVPSGPWMGNEVEKRSYSFELGRVTGADWFLVIDADETVTHVPFDLCDVLNEIEDDYANVTLLERGDLGGASPSPRFFRNTDGLRVEDNHYTYVSHRGAMGLNGAPGAFLLDVKLEHRRRELWSKRRQDQLAYYTLRDDLGLEQPLTV